jgi:hypothetical protein
MSVHLDLAKEVMKWAEECKSGDDCEKSEEIEFGPEEFSYPVTIECLCRAIKEGGCPCKMLK